MNLAEELDRRRQYFDALEEVFNRKGIEYTIHALPEHVGEFEEYHLINLPSPIMLFPAMVDADSPEVNELPDVIVGALRSHRGDAAPGGYTVVLCGYDWTPIAVETLKTNVADALDEDEEVDILTLDEFQRDWLPMA